MERKAAEMAGSKEGFFKELDKLDYLSDSDEVADSFSEIMKAIRKTSAGSATGVPSLTLTKLRPVPLTESAPPQPSMTNIDTGETEFIKETPCRKPSNKKSDNRQMKRSRESSNLEGQEGHVVSKKRRASSFKTVPESQQIFRGLKFCLFP
jgi:hypothetical protein